MVPGQINTILATKIVEKTEEDRAKRKTKKHCTPVIVFLQNPAPDLLDRHLRYHTSHPAMVLFEYLNKRPLLP